MTDTYVPFPTLKTIALTEIQKHVRRIVAENPSYVYGVDSPVKGSCVYVYRGEPSCLLGRAMYAAGVPIDELQSMDRYSKTVLGNLLSSASFENVVKDTFYKLEGDEKAAASWLQRVQEEQDEDEPYDECVERADAEVYGTEGV